MKCNTFSAAQSKQKKNNRRKEKRGKSTAQWEISRVNQTISSYYICFSHLFFFLFHRSKDENVSLTLHTEIRNIASLRRLAKVSFIVNHLSSCFAQRQRTHAHFYFWNEKNYLKTKRKKVKTIYVYHSTVIFSINSAII